MLKVLYVDLAMAAVILTALPLYLYKPSFGFIAAWLMALVMMLTNMHIQFDRYQLSERVKKL